MELKNIGNTHPFEVVSEKQRGFMGAELARKRAGKETKTNMSDAELSRHLKEAKGKTFKDAVMSTVLRKKK